MVAAAMNLNKVKFMSDLSNSDVKSKLTIGTSPLLSGSRKSSTHSDPEGSEFVLEEKLIVSDDIYYELICPSIDVVFVPRDHHR